MAVEINFTICPDHCKNFIITDTTGAYNATDNPGGWDEPAIGPYASSVYESKLYVTFPDEHVVVIDLLDGGLPWPNATFLSKTITNVMLGLGLDVKLPSGKYTFQRIDKALLNDAVTQWIGKRSWDYLIHCIEDCCVQKMGAKMAKERQSPINCDKPDSATLKWRKAWELLQGADYLFGDPCNDEDGALRILAQVQEMCADSGCGC